METPPHNLHNLIKPTAPISSTTSISEIGMSFLPWPLKNDVNRVYQNEFEQPIIYINNDLPKKEQKLVAAHELGHYALHVHINIKFINKRTLLVNNKYERKADIFAAELLLDDGIFENYRGCTLKEISMGECVYPRFVEHKFNNL